MARGRPIPGLNASDSYSAAATKVVEVRARELIDHSRGVLDVGDIERVHDMRVATRRLRAALEFFEPCFPRGDLKAALTDVKALADALGERRDRDVAIAALEATAASMAAPDRPGIASLIERLRAEQDEANSKLVSFVTDDRLALLGEQLSELVAAIKILPNAASADNGRPDAQADRAAGASAAGGRSLEPKPSLAEGGVIAGIAIGTAEDAA
jgi:CHAD domain-containing protein